MTELVRRCAAIAALLLLAIFGGLTIADVLRQPLRVLLVLALIALVTIAVWYSVSRSGARGRFAAVVAVVAFVAADVIVIIMFR